MDQPARFEAAGWDVQEVDGHDTEAVADAIGRRARSSDRPSLIACRTIIGKGAPNLQGSEKTHGAPLGDSRNRGSASETSAGRMRHSRCPKRSSQTWRDAARRGADERREW